MFKVLIALVSLLKEAKGAWKLHKVTTLIGVTMLKAITSCMMLSKNVYSHVINRILKSYLQMSNWNPRNAQCS